MKNNESYMRFPVVCARESQKHISFSYEGIVHIYLYGSVICKTIRRPRQYRGFFFLTLFLVCTILILKILEFKYKWLGGSFGFGVAVILFILSLSRSVNVGCGCVKMYRDASFMQI